MDYLNEVSGKKVSDLEVGDTVLVLKMKWGKPSHEYRKVESIREDRLDPSTLIVRYQGDEVRSGVFMRRDAGVFTK